MKARTVYEAISADAATQFGRTPGFALVDELHAHKKTDLWHTIRTGLTKVPGSLLVIATTAGRGSTSPDFPDLRVRQARRGRRNRRSVIPADHLRSPARLRLAGRGRMARRQPRPGAWLS